MDRETRSERTEKIIKIRSYNSLISECIGLSERLSETDEMKKYLAGVAITLCEALKKEL